MGGKILLGIAILELLTVIGTWIWYEIEMRKIRRK